MARFSGLMGAYPKQFWIIFFNALAGAAGGNLVWPFMTIYLREHLGVSLSEVGTVFAITSFVGYLARFVGGTVVDRFGRKSALVVSLIISSVFTALLSQVQTLGQFAALAAFSSLAWPLSGIATQAMVADLIEPGRRLEAYGLLRVGMNVGVAIGPAVGGFIAVYSYTLSFFIAAAAFAVLLVITLALIRETKPEIPSHEVGVSQNGYGQVMRDYPFLGFSLASAIMNLAYAQMLIFLPVYIKENFGIPESGYGFILATNALMVVFFQFGVTKVTERYPSLSVMAVGALFIALGLGSVALLTTYFFFLLSMVVYTIGELITAPTVSAYTAERAPINLRGRYMAVQQLAMGVGFGMGPIVGGTLNDTLGPAYIWYGAMLLGLLSTAGFVLLSTKSKPRAEVFVPVDPKPVE